MSRPTRGLSLALAMFTVTPVPARVIPAADRRSAGAALRWLPLVGAALGLVATAVGLLFWHGHGRGAPLLGAAMAVATLALLTRGLHLDGLADVADGLGSRRPADEALIIMKQSDIGPFGVAAVVLTLLAQVAALSSVFALTSPVQGALALATAGAAGRYAALAAAAPRVPSARPDGFGALVTGTASVRARALVGASGLVGAGLLAAAARVTAVGIVGLLGALLLGHLVTTGGRRHCVRRLGGMTGDVFGALIETQTTATLLTLAAVLSWRAAW